MFVKMKIKCFFSREASMKSEKREKKNENRKMKCFSKRKLNVRISKTKIKCAILGLNVQFWAYAGNLIYCVSGITQRSD